MFKLGLECIFPVKSKKIEPMRTSISLKRALPVLIVVFVISFLLIAPLDVPAHEPFPKSSTDPVTPVDGHLRRAPTSALIHAILTDKTVVVPHHDPHQHDARTDMAVGGGKGGSTDPLGARYVSTRSNCREYS